MRSWIIAAVMIGACGHGKKPDDHNGSAGSAGSGSASTATSWDVVAFRGTYAIVGADDAHRAAFLAADGRVAGRLTIPKPDVLKSAVVIKDVLVWADDTSVHAWDLAKGAERWHVAPEPDAVLVAGGETVAALHAKGVDILKLADGTRAYHREGAGGNDGKWRDGTFVFSDVSGGIEAVDESTGKQRWTAKLGADKVTNPAVALTASTALAFDGGRTRHDDGSIRFDSGPFTEVELATGKVKATGTIDDDVPGSFAVGSQRGLGYTADGGTFVTATPKKGPQKVFRLDTVGRVMWSATGWPVEQGDYEDNATLLRDGGAVQALLLKPLASNGKVAAHLLVVFDAATGKLHFKYALDPHGTFLGLVHGCAIVIEPDGGKLTCLDDAKGTAKWTRPLAGDPSGFGLKDANSFLVIDANPPVLRRIDATNQVQWQLELPNGVVPKQGDVGPGMVVLASGHGLSVIDLATGKIATATP